MIALRLNKRRDGSYVLTDDNGSPTGPDRAFPDAHWFEYDRLVDMGPAARADGDILHLELCNGRATYRLVRDEAEAVALLGREEGSPLPGTGIAVELVDSELFDPTDIDEKLAAKIRAARFPDGEPGETAGASVAHAGKAVVDEGA